MGSQKLNAPKKNGIRPSPIKGGLVGLPTPPLWGREEKEKIITPRGGGIECLLYKQLVSPNYTIEINKLASVGQERPTCKRRRQGCREPTYQPEGMVGGFSGLVPYQTHQVAC